MLHKYCITLEHVLLPVYYNCPKKKTLLGYIHLNIQTGRHPFMAIIQRKAFVIAPLKDEPSELKF